MLENHHRVYLKFPPHPSPLAYLHNHILNILIKKPNFPRQTWYLKRFVITKLLCLMCLCYLFSFVYVVNFLSLFYFSSKSAVLLLWYEIPKPSKKLGYIAFLKILRLVLDGALLTDTVSHIVYYSCCVKCVNSKVILLS